MNSEYTIKKVKFYKRSKSLASKWEKHSSREIKFRFGRDGRSLSLQISMRALRGLAVLILIGSFVGFVMLIGKEAEQAVLWLVFGFVWSFLFAWWAYSIDRCLSREKKKGNLENDAPHLFSTPY